VEASPLRVTYVGHATTLLELGGVRILTDPVLRRRVAHLRRLVALEGWREAAAASLDCVLVSHLHADHFDTASLRTLDRRVTMLVPSGGAAAALRRRGFEAVHGVDEGSTVRVGPVTVRAVRARHRGSRGVPWVRGPALGYLVEGPATVYFAGDTDIFQEMAELAGADVALLPVAGWGPRLPEGDHLDPLRAAESLKLLRPRFAIPIHWGTLAPLWTRHGHGRHATAPADFRRFAAEIAPEVDVRVLEPGETFALPAARRDGRSVRPDDDGSPPDP
jgi:L-ascorbate metabolism protein UlaG (beta-lactamase superfamily)